MGRCTSLIGLKGKRDIEMLYRAGTCYGSVAMMGGGGGRLINEVERVGEGGGYVDQCCRRIDL